MEILVIVFFTISGIWFWATKIVSWLPKRKVTIPSSTIQTPTFSGGLGYMVYTSSIGKYTEWKIGNYSGVSFPTKGSKQLLELGFFCDIPTPEKVTTYQVGSNAYLVVLPGIEENCMRRRNYFSVLVFNGTPNLKTRIEVASKGAAEKVTKQIKDLVRDEKDIPNSLVSILWDTLN